MLRLGGVASRTYLVAFPAIKQHFQQHGLELDWVLYSSWDALVEAFVRREVDVAWNGPLAYVKIKRRLGDPCQVVAMRDIDVNLVTAFITQPQSAIRTVDDLVQAYHKAFFPPAEPALGDDLAAVAERAKGRRARRRRR